MSTGSQTMFGFKSAALIGKICCGLQGGGGEVAFGRQTQPGQAGNSKLEIRNPKQIQNSEIQMS